MNRQDAADLCLYYGKHKTREDNVHLCKYN